MIKKSTNNKEYNFFENDKGMVEIRDKGNGIFYFEPTGYAEGVKERVLIAEALSWWREKTRAKIISVVGFPEDPEINDITLIVVTE